MSRFNAKAYREAVWRNNLPPRPIQRIPALDLSAADIRRESMQLFYGNLIHDGYTEDQAHEMTIAHFAVADHREQESQS